MGEIRNAERTRKNILQAAKSEFLEKGYSGTKIEVIAKNADIKKQLIYHYFKGKDELLEAVIEYTSAEMFQQIVLTPANPIHVAEQRFRNYAANMDYLKFTAWEAIENQPKNMAREKKRKEFFQLYVEDMKSKQDMGLVPKGLNSEFLTLAIASLTTYPLIFGDVTRMITGYEPSDSEFQEKWGQFLTGLSERIFGGTDN